MLFTLLIFKFNFFSFDLSVISYLFFVVILTALVLFSSESGSSPIGSCRSRNGPVYYFWKPSCNVAPASHMLQNFCCNFTEFYGFFHHVYRILLKSHKNPVKFCKNYKNRLKNWGGLTHHTGDFWKCLHLDANEGSSHDALAATVLVICLPMSLSMHSSMTSSPWIRCYIILLRFEKVYLFIVLKKNLIDVL